MQVTTITQKIYRVEQALAYVRNFCQRTKVFITDQVLENLVEVPAQRWAVLVSLAEALLCEMEQGNVACVRP